MSQGFHHPARRAVPRFVAALCVAGIAGGVALCMLQSNSSKSFKLASAAHAYYARAQHGRLPAESVAYLQAAARETVMQAILMAPDEAQNWSLLSEILLRQQAFGPSAEAHEMAENLGNSGAAYPHNFAADDAPGAVALESP